MTGTCWWPPRKGWSWSSPSRRRPGRRPPRWVWRRPATSARPCTASSAACGVGRPWRVAVGRAHPGAYGIARSYEEAREGLTMAARMHLDSPIVETRDLLTYRVLARDQPALVDLVYSVLHPLRQARGGAGPLVETLAAYFDCGCVATATAARLHLSVRAVTYRLDRVKVPHRLRPARPRASLHPANRRPRREAARTGPSDVSRPAASSDDGKLELPSCRRRASATAVGRWRLMLPITGNGR